MTRSLKRSRQQTSKKTIAEWLRHGEKALASVAKKRARNDAEQLLTYVTKKDPTWLYAHDNDMLTRTQGAHFSRLLRQRAQNAPLAYLRGWQACYGRRFQVGPGVLIPRPETELLIEKTLQLFQATKKIRVADIGSGSGCIGITLACERPEWHVYAVEQSIRALRYTQLNGRQLRPKHCKIIRGNALAPLRHTRLDLIVANLPYLKASEAKHPSIQKEPKKALVGGKDGLEIFRTLFHQLRQRSDHPAVILELDPRRKHALHKLSQRILPDYHQVWQKDLAGHWRLLLLLPKASA